MFQVTETRIRVGKERTVSSWEATLEGALRACLNAWADPTIHRVELVFERDDDDLEEEDDEPHNEDAHFSFMMPTGELEEEGWTDYAVKSLVGQTAPLTRNWVNEGEPQMVKIIGARKCKDELLGEGIWFSVEMVEDEPTD